MAKALSDNGFKIEKTSSNEIRIAGLLHDIGHGPFSHASEDIIRDLPEVKDAYSRDIRFTKSKPHEMISYTILQTKSFKDFFSQLLKLYDETDISLESIAEMIIGSMKDKKHDQYKADIINGAFDADKLDYLTRDAHFTGIKMVIDVDRLLATQIVDRRRHFPRGIMVDVGGVHILEQILFNKMLLYPSVYHHHKVRSTVCMLESIFEVIKDQNLVLDGLKFDKVSDFLSVDDHFFLCESNKPKEVLNQIENIKRRQLLKRALVISGKTVKCNIEKLLSQKERPQNLRDIARLISQDSRLSSCCTFYDVWLDLPEVPRFPEPSQCSVRVTAKDYLDLDQFFPVTEWSESYAVNKWTGFVFGPSNLQKTVATVAKEILRELFGITFNKYAIIEAKHSSFAA
jgi:hypothetical protein